MQPDPQLWVSADIPASSDEQHLLEIQHALITELRSMLAKAGIDPADGTVTARLLWMRKLPDDLLASCEDVSSADMVRVLMDYQPPAYGPQPQEA